MRRCLAAPADLSVASGTITAASGVSCSSISYYATFAGGYANVSSTYSAAVDRYTVSNWAAPIAAAMPSLAVARRNHVSISWDVSGIPPTCGSYYTLVAGGSVAGGETASVEVAKAGLAWLPGGDLHSPVTTPALAVASSGEIYIAGGHVSGVAQPFINRIVTTSPYSTTLFGQLTRGRTSLAGAGFGTAGKVVFAGGRDDPDLWSGVAVADADALSSTGVVSLSLLNSVRYGHRAVRLPSGKAMVVGGAMATTTYPLYDEVYVPTTAYGAACTLAGDCDSGFCVDGRCCDSSCTDLCMACSFAKNATSNRTCLPVATGTDPDSDCAIDSETTCDRDGTCALGVCRLS